MKAKMKPPGGRSIEGPSLRGFWGRSATGQNGRAAKEKTSAVVVGGWMPEKYFGAPAGRSVFHLTSPLIGLLNTQSGAARLIVNPHVLRRFLRFLSTEAPSLHRRYPASLVIRASPSPQRPSLSLTRCRLIAIGRSPLGLPVLLLVNFACLPSPLPRQV